MPVSQRVNDIPSGVDMIGEGGEGLMSTVDDGGCRRCADEDSAD